MKRTLSLIAAAALTLTTCFGTAFATETGMKLISSYGETYVYEGEELLYIMTTENTYDEMGNVIHSVEMTDYLNDMEPVPVIYDYELSYNDQGLISEQIMNLSGIKFYERSYEYDEHGNQTKMVEVNVPITYEYEDENEYNEDGQLIGKVEYFTVSQDEMISQTKTTYTYAYNDAGLLTYMEYTTEEEGMDPITNSMSYEYDPNGHRTGEIQKYGNNSESDLSYTYVFAPDGALESTTIKMISHYADMDAVITETTITYQYE